MSFQIRLQRPQNISQASKYELPVTLRWEVGGKIRCRHQQERFFFFRVTRANDGTNYG